MCQITIRLHCIWQVRGGVRGCKSRQVVLVMPCLCASDKMYDAVLTLINMKAILVPIASGMFQSESRFCFFLILRRHSRIEILWRYGVPYFFAQHFGEYYLTRILRWSQILRCTLSASSERKCAVRRNYLSCCGGFLVQWTFERAKKTTSEGGEFCRF